MAVYDDLIQILAEFNTIFYKNPNCFKKESEVQGFIYNRLFCKYVNEFSEIKLSGNIKNATANKIKKNPVTSVVHSEVDFENTTCRIDVVVFDNKQNIEIVKNEKNPNSTFGKFSLNNTVELAIEIKHWNSNRKDTIRQDYEKLCNLRKQCKLKNCLIIVVDNFYMLDTKDKFEKWVESKINDIKEENIRIIYINSKNSDIWEYTEI